MSKRGKKKKPGLGTVILLAIVVIVCAIVLIVLVRGNLTDGIKSAVSRKVMEQVMEQTIQKALESSGDPDAAAKAKEIVNSIDEEDMREAEAIIQQYADGDSLSDLVNIAGNGINNETIDQIKEYLQENVSEEDIRKLQKLYKKYEEKVP